MRTYFYDDSRQWRSGDRPAITGLKLLVSPFDWISVVPTSVRVEGIDAVRLSDR
jgi:hypothetical protein